MAKSEILLPRWIVWTGLIALFFPAIAATLKWLEFSGGMENLNIATALELRRDHPDTWLIPTLEGEPRVKKPPLTAWITAAAIRPATVEALSNPDPAIRIAAADRLAFEARWPTLLAACLILIAIYELGRIVADPNTGLLAALIAGTSFIFIKFSRMAMIDVHLTLWVTVTNVFLALAILKGQRWTGCLGAGVALGLAFLVKGPVAWAQTLLPVLLFLILRRIRWEPNPIIKSVRFHSLPITIRLVLLILPYPRWIPSAGQPQYQFWVVPIFTALLIMAFIALPWYIYIIRTTPGGLDSWLREITTERGEKPSGILGYLAFLPYLLPWTIAFIGGAITARRAMLLSLCLAVIPLVIMSFYKDRKERYMMPMTGPAAVVAAAGVITLARKREPWIKLERTLVAQHWALLVVAGVLFPAAAATNWIPELRTVTGEPWLSRATGASLTVALGTVIAAAMLVRQRWLIAVTAATLIVMLTVQAALMLGYARTEAGLSPMRPLAQAIWEAAPDARVYNAHPRGKRASVDLSIYLNRPTLWISQNDLANLAPGPIPQVVVMLQDKGEPDPAPPKGWHALQKVRRDKDYWWAFILDPAK